MANRKPKATPKQQKYGRSKAKSKHNYHRALKNKTGTRQTVTRRTATRTDLEAMGLSEQEVERILGDTESHQRKG